MTNVNFKLLDDAEASAADLAKVYAQISEHLEKEVEPNREKIHKALMSLDRSKMSGEAIKAPEYAKFQNALNAAERKAEVCKDALKTLGERIPVKRGEEAVSEIKRLGQEQRELNEEMRKQFLKALPHFCKFLAYREVFGDYRFNVEDFRWLKGFGCPVFFEDKADIIKAVSDAKKKLKLDGDDGPAIQHHRARIKIQKLQEEIGGKNLKDRFAKMILKARAELRREEKSDGKNTDTDNQS